MARQKKTRKISDIMPTRKADKKVAMPKNRRQASRYELDAQAREDKKKRKHKGLSSGSRNGGIEKKEIKKQSMPQDPRVGSRKKVPLIVEEVVGKNLKPIAKSKEVIEIVKPTVLDPNVELMQLENNECLNQLLDDLEAGKKLAHEDQQFVDECLARIEELMEQLGLADEESEEDLYRSFEKIDINQFK